MAAWNPEANEILLKVLEIQSLDDRRAYLDKAGPCDAKRRANAQVLLTAGEQTGSILESPEPGMPAAVDSSDLSEQPGSVIGPYMLVEQIGEGKNAGVRRGPEARPVFESASRTSHLQVGMTNPVEVRHRAGRRRTVSTLKSGEVHIFS